MSENGWSEHKLLILDKLERLQELSEAHERNDETRFTAMRERSDELSYALSEIRADIASLKTKAGVWGLAAGAIPALLTLVYLYLENRHK